MDPEKQIGGNVVEPSEGLERNDTLDDMKKVQTVDTLHNDEGMRILAKHSDNETWDAKEEKRLVRKIDRRLLTILCITYGLQYYDKAMLSQAALFGLRTDLHLNVGLRYTFSASIFYCGFICGAYPAILMAQRFPIERVASIIVALWGACLMCTAACQTWRGLWAQRFFLGFLESGISPMFMLVVGSWYTKKEQALRMGAWYCCTGYVSAVSPLINYGLGHIKGRLSPWRYMYMFAGGITIIWAIAIYLVLPPDPIRAKGFSERERYIAVARMRTNNAGIRNTHFKMPQLFETLKSVNFWLLFWTALTLMIANGPVSTFTPIIIDGFGFDALDSLLLIMPNGIIIGTVELGAAYAALRWKNGRTWIIAICQLGTTLSCLLLWKIPHTHKGLLGAVYILASFGGGYAVIMGLAIGNTAGYTKRSVTSAGLFLGYCLGNIIGPLIFLQKEAPGYHTGFIVTFVTALIALVLIIIYRFVVIAENKRRDALGVEAFDHAYEDDVTDKLNPQFRYIY